MTLPRVFALSEIADREQAVDSKVRFPPLADLRPPPRGRRLLRAMSGRWGPGRNQTFQKRWWSRRVGSLPALQQGQRRTFIAF